MFPTKVILDNTQSSAVDIIRQENGKGCKEKNSYMNKNSENSLMNGSKSDGTLNTDNNAQYNSYSKQGIQKETYYSPYSGT